MPEKTVLPACNPMTFIGEMQEARRHTQALQNVERLQSLGLHNTVIEIVMDDELGGAGIGEMGKRVPEFVVGAVVPDRAVVVALDKP